ncbi:hypothetical protein IEQ34_020470 [Dendrobium chrysotoxum]|uniref:Uncharacterized protein n=1 Tax=Dendrobium chrysotoxum TaxID=161865 RepID=A0AAV7G2M5_DENCH|nr:hypothetical protein IEQ34_020470 [Dendrobium chrysotoxum]
MLRSGEESGRQGGSFLVNKSARKVRMAEWSKAPDSSSGPRMRAWVQIPLLTFYAYCFSMEQY